MKTLNKGGEIMSDGKWKSAGGIWERKTRSKEDMLSIMIGDVPYIAFRNKRKKEGTKNPDWEVFKSDLLKKQEPKPEPEPTPNPEPEEVPF
jgi:hypothetical protein